MSSAYKPQSYNSVSPYLIVDGAAATISFLKQVFDAVELRRMPAPAGDAGRIMHAEVRIDDSVLMLTDGPEGGELVPAHIHIYVPVEHAQLLANWTDVDATYQRALQAGATSVQAPEKKEDEDRRGGVQDAGGTTWWIATKVA